MTQEEFNNLTPEQKDLVLKEEEGNFLLEHRRRMFRVSSGSVTTTGLKLWLIASNLNLADGTAVDTWTDVSGNGFNATATSTARPLLKTNILNGEKIVRFDGVNDIMTLSNTLRLGPDVSMFIVMRLNTITDYGTVIAKSNGGVSGIEVRRSGSNPVLMFTDNVASIYTASTDMSNFYIHTILYNNTSFVGTMYKNGADNTDGDTLTADIGTQATQLVTLGARASTSPNNFADMDLAEILYYDRVLTTAEKTNVEKYLGYKYGITVT